MAVAAAIGAMALAGCGGDDEPPSAEEIRLEEQVRGEEQRENFEALLEARTAERRAGEKAPPAPARFKGPRADRWEVDRTICAGLGPERLADQLDVDDDSDLEAIAEAYSRDWPGRYRRPAYEGCLAGLEDPAPTVE